jgi:transposase
VSQLDEVLKQKIVKPANNVEENLCADAGYTGTGPLNVILAAGYKPHIRGRGEEKQVKKNNPQFKARRWIVESCLSWFNRFRKLNVRYEKLHSTHLALLQLAATIIVLRKIGVIYG